MKYDFSRNVLVPCAKLIQWRRSQVSAFTAGSWEYATGIIIIIIIIIIVLVM